jgi:peptidyl-prolyl cis-trans isomerase C
MPKQTNRSLWIFSPLLFLALLGTQLGGCEPRSAAAMRPQSAQSSCLVPVAAEGTPVARVGDVIITAEQLEARLMTQQIDHRTAQNMGVLRDLLDDEVRFELLARAALVRHLDKDPEVIDAARKVMVRKLLQRDMGPNEADAAAAEAAARSYYDKHRSSYLLPEKRRFSQIELPHTPAGRAQAQGLIDRMRRHHDLRETFSAMAAKFSRDVTTRAHGGDEPFETYDEVSRGFGPEVATAVFAQDPASIPTALVTTPIESHRGWHVLYVAARREALVREFAEVKDAIHAKLAASGREEKFEAYLNALRKVTPVAVYEGPLENIVARWKAHNRQGEAAP